MFDGSEDDEDVEGSRLPLLIVLALLVLAMFARRGLAGLYPGRGARPQRNPGADRRRRARRASRRTIPAARSSPIRASRFTSSRRRRTTSADDAAPRQRRAAAKPAPRRRAGAKRRAAAGAAACAQASAAPAPPSRRRAVAPPAKPAPAAAPSRSRPLPQPSRARAEAGARRQAAPRRQAGDRAARPPARRHRRAARRRRPRRSRRRAPAPAAASRRRRLCAADRRLQIAGRCRCRLEDLQGQACRPAVGLFRRCAAGRSGRQGHLVPPAHRRLRQQGCRLGAVRPAEGGRRRLLPGQDRKSMRSRAIYGCAGTDAVGGGARFLPRGPALGLHPVRPQHQRPGSSAAPGCSNCAKRWAMPQRRS